MRITVSPKSNLGKLSVGLGVTFVLLFLLSSAISGLGGVEPGPLGPILGAAFGLSGIAALVTGLISIIKEKERSFLVFLAMLIGFLTMIFFLGEFFNPSLI